MGQVAQQARGKMQAVAGNTGATVKARGGGLGQLAGGRGGGRAGPTAPSSAGGRGPFGGGRGSMAAARPDGGGKVHKPKISKAGAEYRSGARLHTKRTGKSKVK